MHLPPIDLTDQSGYSLFCQAIVDRNTEAWAVICAVYRPLLMRWLNQSCISTWTQESSGDLTDLALERAWAALTPDCFARFTSLAEVLAYLRTCLTTVVIDCVRSQVDHNGICQELKAGA